MINKSFIALFFLIFFSSCSSFIGSSSVPSEIIRGEGLEVRFNLKNDEWISTTREVRYDIRIKNSGKEDITLNGGDNFKLIFDISGYGDGVIEEDSLNQFYQDVLLGSSKTFKPNEEISREGSLRIVDNIFSNINIEEFNIYLYVNYDYKTTFSNNIDFDLDNNYLQVKDTISQAAPIKIKSIDYFRSSNGPEIQFNIRDEGESGRNSDIVIENYQFRFSNSDITSDCKNFLKVEDRIIPVGSSGRLMLNSDTTEVVISCGIPIREDYNGNLVSTIVSGELNYNYKFSVSQRVRLPDERSLYIVNN
jgi:hypothetical protein